jgi:hypothetical protein
LVERPLQRAVKFVLVDRSGPVRPSDEFAVALSNWRAVASLGARSITAPPAWRCTAPLVASAAGSGQQSVESQLAQTTQRRLHAVGQTALPRQALIRYCHRLVAQHTALGRDLRRRSMRRVGKRPLPILCSSPFDSSRTAGWQGLVAIRHALDVHTSVI